LTERLISRTSNAKSPADGAFREVDGRPALCFERHLRHPVDAVWRAVTDPAELAHWFPATVTVDLREGGAMAFEFADHAELPPSSGTVIEYQPPRRLAFDWDGTVLRFELEPVDGGTACLLRFTHLLRDRDAAARDMAGWHVCLDALGEHLDGKPAQAPPPARTDTWTSLYEIYTGRGVPSGAAIPGESPG
jgi:uncharacterized protein YndB with AHSA1/START domain